MSNYITKFTAENVSKHMTEKMKQNIAEKKVQLDKILVEIYNKSIPKDINEAYSKYRDYFKTASNVRCEGNGLNEGFGVKTQLPSKTGWNVVILPTPTEAKEILKISNAIKKIETKKSELELQIQNTLLSLKTYNRIQKEFPEAFDLLPKKAEATNSIAIPIEDIRKQLKNIK